MTAILPASMLEATRLTRDGKLTEATALLQRLLQGEVPAGAAPASPGTAADPAPVRQPRIIDIDPATGEASAPAATAPRAAAFQRPAGGVGTTAPPRMPEALRGVLDRIHQGGLAQGGMARAEPLPDGARFLAGRFTGETGSRGYKLYIPGTHRGAAAPLVVMLHGCTQSPDDFAAGTRMNALAEEHGCLIVYPGQTQAANAQKCWNWFSPGDQQRDRGEPALIAGITRQVMRDHAVDPRRVYVAGLSAGGAAAAIMAQAYPDLYAAVGVHSGLACGAAHDMPSAFAAMRQGAGGLRRPGQGPAANSNRRIVPTIVFHADRDHTVNPRNGDQVIAQSAAGELRTTVQRGQVPDGHAYTRTLHLDANDQPVLEQWLVHGGGHAWSGGSAAGSYTDPRGPDASREMLRFFLEHPHAAASA
ncbi:PHB depolymerase family esterase [Roseicella sp. DB1501]|uniref:extracellular catalytic domain type 1 short-chain-length polyhydroxyalkanoate depolymerase n=1 Tax=Roseicella sp. DB1501 TaxID=2730925 RepID=UPI0014909540|nr:PHB depolymerase family esterase [Roseicella sp. DB1501]NOG69045.1 PHB depolymerase family esterase [Roseicella sp. DB1501]